MKGQPNVSKKRLIIHDKIGQFIPVIFTDREMGGQQAADVGHGLTDRIPGTLLSDTLNN